MSMGVGPLRPCVEFYLLPLVCINPKPLSFSISNTDIDAPSSHLPASPPIAPDLNVGLVSAGPEMTVACEIPLNLFAIKLILIFINLISQLIKLKVVWKEPLISCNALLLS